MPKEMLDEIDQIVEDSTIYENRSHYFRVAHRELQETNEEFDAAH